MHPVDDGAVLVCSAGSHSDPVDVPFQPDGALSCGQPKVRATNRDNLSLREVERLQMSFQQALGSGVHDTFGLWVRRKSAMTRSRL